MGKQDLPGSYLYVPHLVISGGRVSDVGYALADVTGFKKSDFIDRDAGDVFKKLLKSSIPLEKLQNPEEDGKPYFIFTKDGEARQVCLAVIKSNNDSIIIFREIPNSRLEDSCPCIDTLCNEDSYPLAVYDISSMIIIKSSRKFKELFYPHMSGCGQEADRIDTILGMLDFSKYMSEPLDLLDAHKTALVRNVKFHKLNSSFDVFLMPLYGKNPHQLSAVFLFETGEAITAESLASGIRESGSGYNDIDVISYLMHELKTPINVVVSAIQAMEAVCGKEYLMKANTYLSKIKKNINKQLRLINSLLDISKADSGYMQVHLRNLDIVALTRAIVESVMLYAREKRIEMKFNTLLRNKVIAIDEEKYERILLNLLSNAIKYTPPGKLIYINMSKVKDRICVEVKDEGLGIPLRDQSIIFEKYRQVDSSMARDSQGTGIGLSLVKKLVNVLGGEITVESEEGKGSSFKVYFNETLIDEEESPQVSDWTFDDGQLEHQISIEFSDIFIEEKKKEPASQI